MREILERATAEHRLTGDLRSQTKDDGLWTRLELALGRPAAALSVCCEAVARIDRQKPGWHRAELHVLAARALGWSGVPRRRRRHSATTPEARAELEPEKLPALWAHAGRWEEALHAADGNA